MKIIIRSASAETADINYQGNSFKVTRQAAIYESDDGETRSPISINLETGQAPYAAGEYVLDDASFIVDGKYKRLEFARSMKLKPLKAAAVSSLNQKVG